MALQRRMIICVSAFLLLVTVSGLAGEGQSGLNDLRLDCGSLTSTNCAFSVDWFGARCVLENWIDFDGSSGYHCQTSDIWASKPEQYIETDHCVNACGIQRVTVGFSTDAFFSPGFTDKLCSSECQEDCSNIVDLFTAIIESVGEETSLDNFCNDLHTHREFRRELRDGIFPSSSIDATGPSSSSTFPAEGPSSDLSTGPALAPSFVAGAPSSSHFTDAAEGPAPISGD